MSISQQNCMKQNNGESTWKENLKKAMFKSTGGAWGWGQKDYPRSGKRKSNLREKSPDKNCLKPDTAKDYKRPMEEKPCNCQEKMSEVRKKH